MRVLQVVECREDHMSEILDSRLVLLMLHLFSDDSVSDDAYHG